MSKWLCLKYPNTIHTLDIRVIAAFENGECTVPDIYDDAMQQAGFIPVTINDIIVQEPIVAVAKRKPPNRDGSRGGPVAKRTGTPPQS